MTGVIQLVNRTGVWPRWGLSVLEMSTCPRFGGLGSVLLCSRAMSGNDLRLLQEVVSVMVLFGGGW